MTFQWDTHAAATTRASATAVLEITRASAITSPSRSSTRVRGARCIRALHASSACLQSSCGCGTSTWCDCSLVSHSCCCLFVCRREGARHLLANGFGIVEFGREPAETTNWGTAAYVSYTQLVCLCSRCRDKDAGHYPLNNEVIGFTCSLNDKHMRKSTSTPRVDSSLIPSSVSGPSLLSRSLFPPVTPTTCPGQWAIHAPYPC